MKKRQTEKSPNRRVIETEIFDAHESQPVSIAGGDDDNIARIVSQLGDGDINLKVDKHGVNGWEFCFPVAGTDINEEQIRQDYGPGRYRVRIFQEGECVKFVQLNIAAKLAGDLVNGVGGFDARMLQQILDRQNETLRVIVASINNQPREREPISELTSALVNLHGILPKPAEAAPVEKMLEIFQRGYEMGRDGGPKEPSSIASQLLEVAKEVAPAIMAGMNHNGGAKQLAAGDSAVSGEMLLRQGIAFLKRKCLVGSDPEIYVMLILDNADDPKYQGLIKWVLETPWEGIVQFDSELGRPPHEGFFKAIYDGLRSGFTPENSVVPDTGGPGGNAGNTGDHAGTGKRRRGAN